MRRGFSRASSRSALSAMGLTLRVTKSRTVSRISSCSGARWRLYIRSSELSALLALDARALDHLFPAIEVALNERCELLRPHCHWRDLLLVQELDGFGIAHDGNRGFAQLRD